MIDEGSFTFNTYYTKVIEAIKSPQKSLLKVFLAISKFFSALLTSIS